MLWQNVTFIGIDPTAGQKPFVYAALDHNRRLLALGQGDMDDVLAYTAGQRAAICAVCSPRQVNQGLMDQEEFRQRLSPMPRPGRWSDFRLAEYLVRMRNIQIPRTPAQKEACPKWMQMSFRFYQRLEAFGYKLYPAEEEPRQVLEVYPHAFFTTLLGLAPFPKYSLEGRIQRQLVLHERKVDVPDAMDFFEEITRHRLMKGILPADGLYKPAELDAISAAYTAWLAATQPDQVSCLGDPGEGQIVLPVRELKERY
jgi:hypothetical protein